MAYCTETPPFQSILRYQVSLTQTFSAAAQPAASEKARPAKKAESRLTGEAPRQAVTRFW
jgi:hypothetical protein